MDAHTKEDFDTFISQLQETNQSLDFFCDFDKISQNVADIKLSLCMLNSLIGATDLRSAVETIWHRDRTAFRVMDILIAVRTRDKKKIVDGIGNCSLLADKFKTVDGVMEFLEGTGLANLLQQQKIKDLVDYVFGIETGLDSNARKNRSGHIMENKVAEIMSRYGIQFGKEVYSRQWKEISDVLGDDEKRFDFVIQTQQKTYLMEVNFYSGGGSKLNEVARSYSDIAPKINSVPGFEFIWVTDGIGWKSAKNKLQEAFSIIPGIYNLTTFNDFLRNIKADKRCPQAILQVNRQKLHTAAW